MILDLFITSKTRRKIVAVYTKHPDFRIHVRGLAKMIKEDPGNVQRELSRLEKAGFVTSSRDGNSKVYGANQSFYLFRDLQSMVLKASQMQGRGAKA